MASLSLLHSLSHGYSDPSLKLFTEVTNQRRGDSFCLLTKPHLHHYRYYTHFAMLLTDFPWFHCSRRHSSYTYHPWFPSDFCDARRSSSSVALPSFDFATCMKFHQFYRSRRHSPHTTFIFLWYKNKHIISNTVIIRMQFLHTLVQFNYMEFKEVKLS